MACLGMCGIWEKTQIQIQSQLSVFSRGLNFIWRSRENSLAYFMELRGRYLNQRMEVSKYRGLTLHNEEVHAAYLLVLGPFPAWAPSGPDPHLVGYKFWCLPSSPKLGINYWVNYRETIIILEVLAKDLNLAKRDLYLWSFRHNDSPRRDFARDRWW